MKTKSTLVKNPFANNIRGKVYIQDWGLPNNNTITEAIKVPDVAKLILLN